MSGANPAFVSSASPPPSSRSVSTKGFNRGDEITIVFPFCRATYSGFDGGGYSDLPTWIPGHRYEATGPEDSGEVADAEGSATFTVIDVFKPGRFPTRVFYTRAFTTPDGKTFGKGGLKIATLDKFRRLTRGYRFPYGIGAPLGFTPVADSRAFFMRELAQATTRGSDK